MSDTLETPPIPPKLDFIARRRKQITRWWRKFFVEEAYIPDKYRRICERYGEQVITAMLAGNSGPSSQELRDIFVNEETREYARAWLAEEISYNARRDHWISLRDFLLEIAIVILIVRELQLSRQQEREQNANFNAQQCVLKSTQANSQKTAEILKILSDDQKGQLAISQAQQKEHNAEQNLRPKLELWVQTTDGFKKAELRKPNVATYIKGSENMITLFIRNIGKSPASNVKLESKAKFQVGVECTEGYFNRQTPLEPCDKLRGTIPPYPSHVKATGFNDLYDLQVQMYVHILPKASESNKVELSLSADYVTSAGYELQCGPE